MPRTTRDLLQRTRDLLAERGLAKHTHRTLSGEVCIFGALELARVELDLTHEDAVDAAKFLYAANNSIPTTVNDKHDSTLDDVVTLGYDALALV